MSETLALELPLLATQARQPEVVVNDALLITDAAIAGEVVIAVTSDANISIGTTGVPAQWQHAVIRITDAGTLLTAARDVIYPNVGRRGTFSFINDTGQTLTLKRSGQTGVAINAGTAALVRDDGTDIRPAFLGSTGIIPDNSVTNSMLFEMVAYSFKANATGATAAPTDYSTGAFFFSFAAASTASAARDALELGSGNNVTFNNATVQGNLVVNGTVTTVDSDNLQVEDSLIKVARNNTANSLDIGIYGQYQPAVTPLFTGLFYDSSAAAWRLFTGLESEPTTTVDTGGTGYTGATLVARIEAPVAGSASACSLSGPGDSDTGLFFPAADQVALSVNGAERWRQIGNAMVHGHTASITVGNTMPLQFHSTGATGFGVVRWSATDSAAPELNMGHSKSGVVGTLAANASGDRLGTVGWYGIGTDATTFNVSAIIRGFADAAPTASQVPGRLDIQTTNASGTLTQAMRVNSGQRTIFGSTTTDNGSDTVQVNGSAAISGALTINGGLAAGYLGIPQNSRSAAYTLVLADAGKMISHPAADTTARVFTIPANASVAFPIGTAVTFDNEFGAGVVTIAITSDTLELVGTAGSTGSRTLASGGQATAIKVAATKWRISGVGLT